jgi:putative FmdB family regulatory protein
MPIYAYKCESCGHRQDVLQKMSDPLLTVCPACGASAYVKQVTAAGFQLKGSGWYVTDFRDGGSKKAEADKGAEKGGEKAGEKGADKATDATADKKAEAGSTAAADAKPAAASDAAASKPAVASAPAAAPAAPSP